MSNQDFFKRILMVTLTAIGVLLLWHLRSIFMLGFAALMIAVGVSIPAGWLQRRGLRRGFAILLSGLITLLIALFLTLWIVPTLIQETLTIIAQLPVMIGASIEAYEDLRANNEFLSGVLPTLEMDSFQTLQETLGLEPESLRNLASTIIGTGTSTLFAGLGLFGYLLTNLLFVLFIAAFFLYEPTSYIKASLYLVPRGYRARLLEIWDELYETLRTWISAQFLSISITAALVFGILGLLLGMPFPLIVAAFAGFATFIPNIGAFLPLIPIVIFTVAEKPEWLFIYVGVYLLIQLTESNIITPLIVKAELDIPSGVLMLFQLIAAALLGAMGLLFAVPLLALLITLVREFYTKDMLGVGDEHFEIISTIGKPLQIDELSESYDT